MDGVVTLGAVAAALASFERPGLAVAAGALLAIVVGATRGRSVPLALATAAATVSGLLHLSVAPAHFAEWWGFGLFFVLAGEAQIAWAILLGRRGGARTSFLGLAGSVVLIALWALSRTAGLPLGPDAGAPEAVGLRDAASVALELVTAGACAWTLLAAAARRSPRAAVLAVVFAALGALATVA